MTSRAAALTLGVALLLAALTACTVAPEPAEPTPVFSSEEEAFAAAEETYRAYVDALNRVDLSDPETFEDVYAWTTGDLNASDRRGLSEYHANGTSVTGDSRIALVEGAATDLMVGTVDLAVCLDVSDVEVTADDGSSLVDPDRTTIQGLQVSFTPSSDSPTTVLIEAIGPREGDPICG